VPTHAELVTPERILFSGEAEFVVLRADGGEVMFLPNHAPFVAGADISVLRIAPAEEGGEEFRAAVHGGFVHVANNRVTVLASVAEPAGEIDVDRARRALEAAQAVVGGGEGAEAAKPAHPTEHDINVEERVEDSPVMKALLYPDDPEVALRRAQTRLEAAGALEQTH
jgi:F-type H+-transporting ATPase subunit epsilon